MPNYLISSGEIFNYIQGIITLYVPMYTIYILIYLGGSNKRNSMNLIQVRYTWRVFLLLFSFIRSAYRVEFLTK